MNILIVDDEPLARERLKRLLAGFNGYTVAGEAGNGVSALQLARSLEPDLVLLDIHMGGGDGLTLARELAREPLPPAVIFTTAHAEHALSAFDAQAQAYLLKPVARDKLREALQRVRRPSRATEFSQAPKRAFLLADVAGTAVRIAAEDLLYFEAEDKYVKVVHRHGVALTEEPLKALEEDFAPGFVRIHRSALVAVRHLLALEPAPEDGEDHHRLRLRHVAAPLPVSRRRLADVRRALEQGGA